MKKKRKLTEFQEKIPLLSESSKKTYIDKYFLNIYFQNCFNFLFLRLSFGKAITHNLVYLTHIATKTSKFQGKRYHLRFSHAILVLKFFNLMTNSVCVSLKCIMRTMDHLLDWSLISDNTALSKERVHDGKFIKRHPTPPATAPYVTPLYCTCHSLSNCNRILLFQHKIIVQRSANHSLKSKSSPPLVFGN